MPCRYLPASIVVCLSLISSAQFAAADDAQEQQAAQKQKVETLIRQLGDDAYAVREKATDELVAVGLPAREALEAAVSSGDAEVRSRARRLLVLVAEAEFQRKLREFAADVDGKQGKTLPGWEQFRKFAGDDRVSRDLFVEMAQNEPALLEGIAGGPKLATTRLAERIAKMRELGPAYRAIQQQQMTVGSSMSLLLAVADHDVEITDEITQWLIYLPHQQFFLQALRSGPRMEISKKLLGRWVGRSVSPTYMPTNISFAMQYDLKEAVVPTEKILKTGGLPAYTRQQALMLLAKLGGKEQLATVETLFKDTEAINHYGPQRAGMVQVRDAALLAALQVQGHKPSEFGFVRLEANPTLLFNPQSILFPTEDLRKAAFRKYELTQAMDKAKESKDAGQIAETTKALVEHDATLAPLRVAAEKVLAAPATARPRSSSRLTRETDGL